MPSLIIQRISDFNCLVGDIGQECTDGESGRLFCEIHQSFEFLELIFVAVPVFISFCFLTICFHAFIFTEKDFHLGMHQWFHAKPWKNFLEVPNKTQIAFQKQDRSVQKIVLIFQCFSYLFASKHSTFPHNVLKVYCVNCSQKYLRVHHILNGSCTQIPIPVCTILRKFMDAYMTQERI